MYGPDHDEPMEQGAVRKAAAKRKAREPDPAAEAALADIDYKACAASGQGCLESRKALETKVMSC